MEFLPPEVMRKKRIYDPVLGVPIGEVDAIKIVLEKKNK